MLLHWIAARMAIRRGRRCWAGRRRVACASRVGPRTLRPREKRAASLRASSSCPAVSESAAHRRALRQHRDAWARFPVTRRPPGSPAQQAWASLGDSSMQVALITMRSAVCANARELLRHSHSLCVCIASVPSQNPSRHRFASARALRRLPQREIRCHVLLRRASLFPARPVSACALPTSAPWPPGRAKQPPAPLPFSAVTSLCSAPLRPYYCFRMTRRSMRPNRKLAAPISIGRHAGLRNGMMQCRKMRC